MPDTPARPELPPLKRSIETWGRCDPAAMAAQSEAAIYFAFQDLLSDVRTLARLLADERRKALESAEALLRQRLEAAKRTHEISGAPYSEGMRDAYSVAVLEIQSMADRKEPT